MVSFAEESFTPPKFLSVYRFVGHDDQEWIAADSPSVSDFPPTELQLITWNIDAGSDRVKRRTTQILKYLRKKVFGNTLAPSCCILLQEVHQDVLPVLLKNKWVRQSFLVTPISADDWITPYGIVTLISKCVPVTTAFSIELPMTTVGRLALFVDIHLSAPPPETENQKADKRIRTIRIANTHLEPEPPGARLRPRQLKQIARMLNVANLEACICAGSMCSFHDSDNVAPASAGFADTCKGMKRDSTTWGHQPPTEKPPARLDKILYFPTERVEVGCSTRIGHRTRMMTGGYLSDHCGLSAMVKILREH